MEAKLNIYANCESEEPIKTYVCRRLLLNTSKEVAALAEKLQGKSLKEQEEITINIIKTIFPDFKDEEYNYIDPVEWIKFINDINSETAQIQAAAKKN